MNLEKRRRTREEMAKNGINEESVYLAIKLFNDDDVKPTISDVTRFLVPGLQNRTSAHPAYYQVRQALLELDHHGRVRMERRPKDKTVIELTAIPQQKVLPLVKSPEPSTLAESLTPEKAGWRRSDHVRNCKILELYQKGWQADRIAKKLNTTVGAVKNVKKVYGHLVEGIPFRKTVVTSSQPQKPSVAVVVSPRVGLIRRFFRWLW